MIDENIDIIEYDNDSEYELIELVVSSFNGIRIDKYISDNTDLSRSMTSDIISKDLVTVNNKTIKSSYKVKEGDIIKINVPKPQKLDIKPENIPLDIVYEDDDILVVNKPKDMVVHPSHGHNEHTLVNALLYYLGDSLSSINGVLRPGIVHRIDKDTTGLLIVCKNDKAHIAITDMLKEHTITRTYHLVVKGNITEDGVVHTLIGRDSRDRKKMAVVDMNGKDAITHYHVVSNFKGYTYLTCELETGRTHQIRVHMASLGHPVLGDETYGGLDKNIKMKLQGQALHAKSLKFRHPITNKELNIECELPDYFVKLLTLLPKQ